VDTGEELASVELARLIEQEATVLSSPVVANGRLIIGTGAGVVVCLGAKP
jgi:hypothetical protein